MLPNFEQFQVEPSLESLPGQNHLSYPMYWDTRGVSIVCIGGKPRQVECPGFPPP
jgi:hypothetical protein